MLSIDMSQVIPDTYVNVSETFASGACTCVTGASGAGKTSLLKILSGLTYIPGTKTQFQTEHKTEYWQQNKDCLATEKRSLSMVTQDVGLFSNMDVKKNLSFTQSSSTSAHDENFILELLALKPLLKKTVTALSGGEAQRVALGRAMLNDQSILLLDEPLSSVDINHKRDILAGLKTWFKSASKTVLYVTHSTHEIELLADHLLVLDKGKVIHHGEVALGLQTINLESSVTGKITALLESGMAEVVGDFGVIKVPANHDWQVGQPVSIQVKTN